MKSIINIFFISLLFISNTIAQDCPIPNQQVTLDGKEIKFTSGNGGVIFGYNTSSFNGIVAPFNPPGIPNALSLNDQFIWIGSQNSAGDLKLSVTTNYENDFFPGPIFIENTPATFDCENYNKIWVVEGEEIVKKFIKM